MLVKTLNIKWDWYPSIYLTFRCNGRKSTTLYHCICGTWWWNLQLLSYLEYFGKRVSPTL